MSINFKYLRKIGSLKILSKFFKKHPAYKVISKTTVICEECVLAWNSRLQLNTIEVS